MSAANYPASRMKDNEEVSDGINRTVGQAKNLAKEAASTLASGKKSAVEALETAREAGSRAVDVAARQVKESPFVSMATVFAVGVIVGVAIDRLACRR